MRHLDAAWEAMAQSVRRLDSTVLSGVLHDLSGPLTALLTSNTLLAQDLYALPPEKRWTVQTMQRTGIQLQSRLEDLRCAAALSESNLQIHARPMELREVVLEVLPLLVPLIDHRKQRLEVIDRGEAHIVSADPRRVAQILINLILHASDHGGEGSNLDST